MIAAPAPASAQAAAAPIALAADGLRKQFGSVQAVAGISLRVATGEIVGLLGPNGAGKSTTLRLLSGCMSSDAGSVHIAGHDLQRDAVARTKLGYAPEEPPLYDDMRLIDYLLHVARLKGIESGLRRAAADRAMRAVDIAANAQRRLGVLSKGNRQRAGLAQALLGDPAVLLMDEPTNGLDPAQVANLRDVLRRLSANYAIVLSTHVLAEVDALCSRVIVIHRGAVLADEPIQALRERTRIQRVRVRLRDGQHDALLTALGSCAWARAHRDGDDLLIDADPSHRSELVRLCEAHGGLRELVEERRSLEDVFRDLVAAPAAHAAA